MIYTLVCDDGMETPPTFTVNPATNVITTNCNNLTTVEFSSGSAFQSLTLEDAQELTSEILLVLVTAFGIRMIYNMLR